MLTLRTLHWPLVNDAAQFHYLCFLMDHGMAPYRDVIEMNLPGTWMYNSLVMHTLGPGALAWRCFDILLMAAMSAAMIAIAWPYDRFAGIFAAAFFVLYHGRDGTGETGQRDLVIAVLMMAACAFLFHAVRRRIAWPAFFFALCSGLACSIKPTPLPFACALLVLGAIALRYRHEPVLRTALFAAGGFLASGLIVLAFLIHEHAVAAFFSSAHVMLPYYATIRQCLHFMLRMLASSSIWMIAALIAVVTILRRSWHTFEEIALLSGIFLGLVGYFAQGKGNTYHRYPMLAFLLLWGGIQFMLALRKRGTQRIAGAVGILIAVVLAPLYTAEAIRTSWNEDYIHGLTADLNTLGSTQQLSGEVQCFDTPAECDTTLYRMQLMQATGLAYDYWIFGPADQPAIQYSRQKFWKDLEAHPPQILIFGTGLYPKANSGYAKLDQWPQFGEYLRAHYTLRNDRSFRHGIYGPLAYRIYVKNRE